VLLALGAEIAAEKQRQHLLGIDALVVALGEVAGAKEIHHTTDGAALIKVAFPLKLRDAGGGSEELRQMTSGPSSPPTASSSKN
jgi:hypothetical protein